MVVGNDGGTADATAGDCWDDEDDDDDDDDLSDDDDGD